MLTNQEAAYLSSQVTDIPRPNDIYVLGTNDGSCLRPTKTYPEL